MDSIDQAIAKSVRYLGSQAARQSIAQDHYWPKWDSPWWHMLLLHEMGETRRIPQSIVEKMIRALGESPVKIFPYQDSDIPRGMLIARTHCHCSMGSIYQVLSAWGVDVDTELPWIRPWFLRYQLPDGGLTCDNGAYLIKDDCPSSMVGTISPFEAILLYAKQPWTAEEQSFVDRAAGFLIQRQLVLGSRSKHNQEEQLQEANWLKLCFPRFYFYDILRGLNALLIWSEKTGRALSKDTIAPAFQSLATRFPDGKVIKERESFAGRQTLAFENGHWVHPRPAARFALLDATSRVGEESIYLSRQWAGCRARAERLGLA